MAKNPMKVKKHKEAARPLKERSCIRLRSRILESRTPARSDGIGPSKFRVVLIQEGLGNLKDAFYYPRESLEGAINAFEGKKIFADHPDAIEEQARPERSVKDILGHFENVLVEDDDDGSAMLTADLIMLDGMNTAWARELVGHQIEYAKKYPDQEFVGISINASGDANEIPLEEFLEQATIPEGAKPKLIKALSEGVSSVRVVKQIEDAVSADLVTSPGARGRILDFIEQEKKKMGKEAKMKHNEDEAEDEGQKHPAEAEDEGADGADGGGDGDGGDHADADQDKALIKKMLKKHMGLDDGDDGHEEAMEKAHQAYQAYREMGEDEAEAAHSAAKAYKLHSFAKKKQAESEGESENEDAKVDAKGYEYSEDEAEGEAEAKKKKESGVVMKLAGRVAFLERELKERDLIQYLDKKLKETGLYREETKKIRALIGKPKTKEQIDSTVKMFTEAYKAGRASAADGGTIFNMEKTGSVETSLDFSDCTE